MKILIDIPEQKYRSIQECAVAVTDEIHKAVLNGIPYVRNTGRWEWFKESPTYMRCSACGNAEFRKTKYCPHCGAKMEGAEE